MAKEMDTILHCQFIPSPQVEQSIFGVPTTMAKTRMLYVAASLAPPNSETALDNQAVANHVV